MKKFDISSMFLVPQRLYRSLLSYIQEDESMEELDALNRQKQDGNYIENAIDFNRQQQEMQNSSLNNTNNVTQSYVNQTSQSDLLANISRNTTNNQGSTVRFNPNVTVYKPLTNESIASSNETTRSSIRPPTNAIPNNQSALSQNETTRSSASENESSQNKSLTASFVVPSNNRMATDDQYFPNLYDTGKKLIPVVDSAAALPIIPAVVDRAPAQQPTLNADATLQKKYIKKSARR